MPVDQKTVNQTNNVSECSVAQRSESEYQKWRRRDSVTISQNQPLGCKGKCIEQDEQTKDVGGRGFRRAQRSAICNRKYASDASDDKNINKKPDRAAKAMDRSPGRMNVSLIYCCGGISARIFPDSKIFVANSKQRLTIKG